MSLALHYWMGDVHHCSGLSCVEWDVKLYYTIPYHTCTCMSVPVPGRARYESLEGLDAGTHGGILR